MEGMATLEELETSWSIDDVDRANAALDMKTEVVNALSKPEK